MCLMGRHQSWRPPPRRKESLSLIYCVWILRGAAVSGRNLAHNRPYEIDYSSTVISKSHLPLDLLSAPLTIPLICCHINSFRRASSCGEAMARRRKEGRRAGIALRVVSPPACGHRGVPARGVVPERCHALGSAVDGRRDTPAGARRAERAADGGVMDVPRALSVSPRAP
jgi:hypothetical protein